VATVECTRCGSTELEGGDGFVVCVYCQSRYASAPVVVAVETTIGLGSDIDVLLRKCRTEPANRRRYASLVLDLDPTNQEAHQYLR
jgi:hypothetical protein